MQWKLLTDHSFYPAGISLDDTILIYEMTPIHDTVRIGMAQNGPAR